MSWPKSIVDWTEGTNAFISVVFTWQLQEAYQRAVFYKAMGYSVRVGGPAIHGTDMFEGVAEAGGHLPDVVRRHNPDATFTTRGCIRKCPFCLVPKIEPEFIELDDFPIRPLVCDNNFLASSDYHFDMVCEKLFDLKNVDFNQGLDSRLLTPYRARKLANLNTHVLRLAFDSRKYESQFSNAFQTLVDAGVKPDHIRVYVLINFRESVDDALYRLEKVRELGGLPSVMRYQPVDTRIKNSFLAPGWNERDLLNIQRYYSRLTWLGWFEYSDYDMTQFGKHDKKAQTTTLFGDES